MNHDSKEVVTRKEAAELLGVSTSMVDIYRLKGFIKPISTKNGKVLFKKNSVESYRDIKFRNKVGEK